MKSDVLQSSGCTDARPRPIYATAAVLDFAARNDIRVALCFRQGDQYTQCLVIEVDDFRASFAVAQSQAAIFEVDISPMQVNDFALATTSEHQQSDCGRREGVARLFDLRVQRLSQPFEFISG